MGELFEQVRPIRPLEWTGERLTTDAAGQVEVEHLHRYFLARHIVRGLDVLDIASGEGYGSAFLAQTARSVVGVEIDPVAVEHARVGYIAKNLRFEQGSAQSVPLPDRSVDVVVSFETIEHFYEQERFLTEIRRVLRPEGVLIVSSPNRDIYSPPSGPSNPYHVRELTRDEFVRLLSDHFQHVTLLGQRPIVGSAIVSETATNRSGETLTFERRSNDRFEASAGFDRPLYYVAVASDRVLPSLPESFYFERGAADDIMITLPALRKAVADRDTQIRELQARFDWFRVLFFCGELSNRMKIWRRLRRLAPKPAPDANRGSTNAITSIAPRGAARIARHAAPAPETIMLPKANSNPDVSVIIVSYGHVDFTLRCLRAIAASPPRDMVEIVVSDDCSGAQDLIKLTRVSNLVFLQPPKNLGFLKHVNWAVAQTRGKYILLLNNDTEVRPGAIDALVETARAMPDIGLVGSKLVYPNGKLQEAGGIVWNDASAWNYGQRDSPDKPEYNYVRDVDYVSGASALVPRDIWDRLAGFDETFAPAYCEDSDFAFRIRQIGLRVVYQPESVVVHHEGISHGTDVNSGVKAYQTVNQARLKERWLPTLQADHFPNGEHVMRARDRSRGLRVMLIVDHYVPEPDRDAGSRTMIEMIRCLQTDGWIIKFWPENLRYDPVYTLKLQRLGVETLYRPWVKSFNNWLSANGDEIDLVFLNRPNVAPKFIKSVRKIVPGVPIMYYGHDLHFERMKLQARLTGDSKLAAKSSAMESVERTLWNQVDLVLYPSQEEVDRARELEKNVVAHSVVPYCFDTFVSRTAPPPTPSLIFVAGFSHIPNVDAATWLVDKILPLVRRHVPLAKLSLVGSNPTDKVRALAGANVEVTGFVTDETLVERYAAARVAVVPLRFGAGVKLKVVEGMQMGIPLVTTTVGSQGLPGLADVAMVRDEPELFAQACVTLLQDDLIWQKQSASQSDYVRRSFSVEAMRSSLSEATARIPARRRP
jgi:GT2 family glycosyltransferase/SAM-dependent methyltransferase/glycosyltransferase involved in cell wall biosynthesis